MQRSQYLLTCKISLVLLPCNQRPLPDLWLEALRAQPSVTMCSLASLLTYQDKASQVFWPGLLFERASAQSLTTAGDVRKAKHITEGQSFIFIIKNNYTLVTQAVLVWLILAAVQEKKKNFHCTWIYNCRKICRRFKDDRIKDERCFSLPNF